jgi:hypothetical protein
MTECVPDRRATSPSRWKTVILAAGLQAGALATVVPAAFGQTEDSYSIRVETNLVLVPTLVFQKARVRYLTEAEVNCSETNAKTFARLQPSEPYLPTDCDGAAVHGLTMNNFQVFEDGAEQKVETVTLETIANATVRDDHGKHREWSLTPRGKWSSSELSGMFTPSDTEHFYLVSYTPPPSREGSCHHVSVKVDRTDAVVFSRDTYCNVKSPPSDPLSGTKFGDRLERNAASPKSGKMGLSLQAGYFYADAESARVQIAVEIPWDSLQREWEHGEFDAKVGVLGVVRRKNGTLAARFSDLACCSTELPGFARFGNRSANLEEPHPEFDPAYLPARYDTQLDLPPGEYEVQVVVSDEAKFGRATTSLSIDTKAEHRLALSSVLLCKRFRDATAANQEAATSKVASEYVPLISKGMEFTPAGDMRFTKKDPWIAYFEVYEPLLAGAGTTDVQFQMRITDVKTGEVKTDTGLRPAKSCVRAGKTTIAIAERMAVEKLPSGTYRVEIQASDSAGNHTGWRATSFAVK